jgi:hypothetical protein
MAMPKSSVTSVEERRVRQVDAAPAEVGSDVEHQPVAPGLQAPSL